MNGLSLLVALAAVGIDVGWEPTSSGKDLYTIRIEPLVVDTLRTGSAIESLVKPNERTLLRQFRVVVGPRNQRTDRLETTTANEVSYGWSQSDAGVIEYYVQISPERLETLSRGVPLDCIVHQELVAIDKIFVFVGDAALPRKLLQGSTRTNPPPRDLATIGNPSGGGVATVSGTETAVGAPRYGNPSTGTQGSAQGNSQVNISDPNRNNSYSTQTTQGTANGNPNYVQQPPYDYNNQGSSSTNRYGQLGDNTLPVPPLDTNRPTDYDRGRNLNYDYNRNQYTQQQAPPNYTQTAALPNQPPYNPQPGPAPNYGNPAPTYLTGTAANPATDALAATLAFTQAQLEKAQLEKERLSIANTVAEKTVAPEIPKSSKPLILTTFALFASISANLYLGWLAWSFFWRFRDAASDLSRARSNAFPSSSLAGH